MTEENQGNNWELGAPVPRTTAEGSRGYGGRRAPWVLFALFVIPLAVGGALFLRESFKQFPSIPAGRYLGVVKNSALSGGELELSVERAEGSSTIKLTPLAPGWDGAQAIDSQKILSQGVYLSNEGGARVRLFGTLLSEGRYGGEAELSSQKGTWEVGMVRPTQNSASAGEDADPTLWLSLKAELAAAHGAQGAFQSEIASADTQLKELLAALEDEEQLKREIARRTEEVTGLLRKTRDEVGTIRKKATTLAAQLQVSLRVAPMGKLVSLARESSERETRWAESVAFRSGPPVLDMTEDLARAQRIELLKQQIAEEELRIRDLSPDTQSSKTKSGPPSFDALWGEGGE